jgi:flagellar M-ring protein FliF
MVDPDKQATSTEQRYEITPGAQGGAASSNVATSYDNSKITENFSGAIGNIKRLSVAVLVNDKMTMPKLTGDASKDKDAKPTYTPRTAEEVARIESLVRSAVGADSTRGDIVTVVATRLDGDQVATTDDVTPKPSVVERVQEFQKPGIAVLAMITLIIVAMMTLKALKPVGTPGALARGNGALALPAPAGAENYAALNSGEPARMPAPAYAPLDFPDRGDTRGRVIATVAAKPDVSARVVRSWMKES